MKSIILSLVIMLLLGACSSQQTPKQYANSHQLVKKAKQAWISESTLMELSRHPDPKVRMAVIENKQVPIHLLATLSQDKDTDVRTSVAQSPLANQSILETLASDSAPKVRAAVLENPNTDKNIVALIANDQSVLVQKALASNPLTPKETLRCLGQSKDAEILRNLSSNIGTPEDVLSAIANSNSANISINLKLANNPSTGASILETLYREQPEDFIYARKLQIALAGNPHCPAEILKRIYKNPPNMNESYHRHLRKSFLKNPNTPKDVLKGIYAYQQEKLAAEKAKYRSQKDPWDDFFNTPISAKEKDAMLSFAGHYGASTGDQKLGGATYYGLELYHDGFYRYNYSLVHEYLDFSDVQYVKQVTKSQHSEPAVGKWRVKDGKVILPIGGQVLVLSKEDLEGLSFLNL